MIGGRGGFLFSDEVFLFFFFDVEWEFFQLMKFFFFPPSLNDIYFIREIN